MKGRLISTIAAILVAHFVNAPADAQDGWFRSAKPPIVVSYDGEPDYEFHFTNTSDNVLHGVKLHWEKDGQQLSWVIIDTIEPHKTVRVDAVRLEKCCALDQTYREATITCDNYSSPIKIAQ